ncbi:hypothetical protein ACQCN2_09375 [Brevibacillus ginsengisoli]|uniref:hypothetical protein n=1 Tax=Brevibacillus ginsengisoli TaxID=363854 RepID=UPI003CF46672
MQTGQLLSSMMNRLASTSAKPIDLTPGQVFKGTVTKLYPDNMAQVQIGGVQIQAKLEANLEVGQKAWLQVQPTTNPVTLKVLTSPDNPQQLQDTTVEGLMRSLGVNDTQESRALVESLVKQNLPVTKEIVNAFLDVAKTQGSSKEVVDAFVLAMKRNLPPTNDVVAALKTFVSGKPLAESISQFLREAETFIQSSPQSGKTIASSGNMPQELSTLEGLRQLVTKAADKVASLPVQITSMEPELASSSSVFIEKGNSNLNPQGFASSSTSDANLRTAQGNSQGAGQTARQPSAQPPAQAAVSQANIQTSNPTANQRLSATTAQIDPQTFSAGQFSTSGLNTEPQIEGQKTANSTVSKILDQHSSPITLNNVSGQMQQATDEVKLSNGSTQAGGRNPLSSPEQNGSALTAGLAQEIAEGAANTADEATQPQLATAKAQQLGQPVQQGLKASKEPQAQQDQLAQLNPTGKQSLQAEPQAVKPPLLSSATDGQQQNQTRTDSSSASSAGSSSAQPADQSNPAPLDNKPLPLRELFQKLGVSHERHIAFPRLGSAEMISTRDQLDNVKSMLMQISQAEGQLPGSLKEAANTLLQQVTGQQLLLTQPTNQAISQVVMQIPLRTDDGDTTAFVQIESKKQSGGQLDAENCRLFFNLDLHMLGITMVDVNIVNKIVNINIYNNQPWIEGLITHSRDSFASQLRDVGYQLSHLKTQPILQPKSPSAQLVSQGHLGSTYKGVDLLI